MRTLLALLVVIACTMPTFALAGKFNCSIQNMEYETLAKSVVDKNSGTVETTFEGIVCSAEVIDGGAESTSGVSYTTVRLPDGSEIQSVGSDHVQMLRINKTYTCICKAGK